MGLLDSDSEEPKSKLRRYVVTWLALGLFLALGLWYLFRFYPEKRTAERFLDALVTGDTAKAYGIWKLGSSYKGQSPAEISKVAQSYAYQDFLDDWGPSGYYGPVKSYRIETAQKPKGGTGVIVVVELSPYQPFPSDADVARNRRTKEVRIWVESKDKSLSFPP